MSFFDSHSTIEMNSTSAAGQLRPVAVITAAQIVGMILFTILAPRMMGPDLFGQFAVILSVLGLGQAACNIGGRFVFGRFIPEYASRGETEQVRAVFMHVLASRLVLLLIAAPVMFAFLRRLLPDASTVTLLASTTGFLAMMAGAPMYNVFFGLNRLALSMAKEPFSQYLLLVFLVALGGITSLERASFALLLTQTVVLGAGMLLSWRLFTLDRSAFHLPSLWQHVQFGLAVFSASLLLRIPWRLGESALALQGVPSSEIAFFSVAISVTTAFTRVVGSATTLLVPSLSLRQVSGDREGRDKSLGTALRYLTVAAGLFVLTVLVLAPTAVPLLLGSEYLGVLPNLYIVALAALPAPLIRSALSLAVVRSRLKLNFLLGGVAIVVFVLAALVLVPAYASRGASVSLVLAIVSAGIVAALQMRRSSVLVEARLGRHLLIGAVAGCFILLAGPSPIVASVATVLYLVFLNVLAVIRWHELRQLVFARGPLRR